MDNEWVAPQVGALTLAHYETLDGQSSLPFFSACLELLASLCQFLLFYFGVVEMKINLEVGMVELET